MANERRRILYEGRVQGVGFRFKVQRLASEFAVEGFVRNLDDGRVEVVAEGEPEELDRFAAAIAREMGGKIRGADVQARPAGETPLAGFIIET